MVHSPAPFLFALTLLFGAPASPLQAQSGPFEKGLRWIHGADLGNPWIPTRVEFAAGAELCWVGTGASNTRLNLYAGPGSGAATPVFTDTGVSAASSTLEVKSGADASHLFALLQYPDPDVFHRRSECVRYDALGSAAGAAFSPNWVHSSGFTANGPARIDADDTGSVVVLVTWNDALSFARLDRLDGDTGALLQRRDLPATTLETIDLSGDGERLAITVDQRLLVLDATFATLHEELLPAPSIAVALDRSGGRLILGEAGRLRVFEWNGLAYTSAAVHLGDANEVVSRVSLSPAGESYAAAWYRTTGTDRLRYEVYEGGTHLRVNHVVQSGQPGGLQNSPVAVSTSENGQRIAFASWGKGDADPEVVLLQLGQVLPVLEVDLPGSALDLCLDQTGTRIALVTKNLHANQLGTTGEVRFYDTGERDLELLEPARIGHQLEVGAKAPGASFAIFLIGSRNDVPTTIPGASGELRLDRSRAIRSYARSVDPSGRADLILPLSTNHGLIGLERSIQAVYRVQGQLVFGETVLDPLIY